MPVALYFCMKLVPDGHQPHANKETKKSLRTLMAELFSNKMFVLFILVRAIYGFGVFMWFTLMFIFVDSFLELGESFAILSLVGLSVSILAAGFWYGVARFLGKKLTWMIGVFLYAIALLVVGLLEPGKAQVFVLAVVMLLMFFGSTSVEILSPSLLSDIADYGTWKFGVDRTATYFSIYAFGIQDFNRSWWFDRSRPKLVGMVSIHPLLFIRTLASRVCALLPAGCLCSFYYSLSY